MTRVQVRGRRSKYGAQPTVIDGIRFDSKREGARYQELRLLERAGEIQDLELQPEFLLYAGCELSIYPDRDPLKLGVYRADFRYIETRTGEVVVEDVKGYDVPLGKWKRRMAEAIYGVAVRVVR